MNSRFCAIDAGGTGALGLLMMQPCGPERKPVRVSRTDKHIYVLEDSVALEVRHNSLWRYQREFVDKGRIGRETWGPRWKKVTIGPGGGGGGGGRERGGGGGIGALEVLVVGSWDECSPVKVPRTDKHISVHDDSVAHEVG